MNTKTYKKGEIIFRQGDAAETMYDILWGSVGIYLGYDTDEEKKLTELSGNDLFGEMGLIDRAPRSATAVALEDRTQLGEIDESDLGRLFSEKPAKVLMIMQQLSNRLRKLTRDYMDACKTAAGMVEIEVKPEEVSKEVKEEVKAKTEHYAQIKLKGYYITI